MTKKRIFLVQGGSWTPADDLNYRPRGNFGDDYLFVVDNDDMRNHRWSPDRIEKTAVDFSRHPNDLLADVIHELDTQQSVYYLEDVKTLIRSLQDSRYQIPEEPPSYLIEDFGLHVARYLMRFAGKVKEIDIPEKIVEILNPVIQFGLWHIPERSLYKNASASLIRLFGAETESDEVIIRAGFEKWQSSLYSRTNYLNYAVKFDLSDLGFESRLFDRFDDSTARIIANQFAEVADGLVDYFSENKYSYSWLWTITSSLCPPLSYVKYPPWSDGTSDQAFHFRKKVRALLDDVVVRRRGDDPAVQRWRHESGDAHKQVNIQEGEINVLDGQRFWTNCAVCIEAFDQAIKRIRLEEEAQNARRQAHEEAIRVQQEAIENRRKLEAKQREDERQQAFAELEARANKVADEADKLVRLGCSRTAALRTVSAKYEEFNRSVILPKFGLPTITETPTEFHAQNFPPPNYPVGYKLVAELLDDTKNERHPRLAVPLRRNS